MKKAAFLLFLLVPAMVFAQSAADLAAKPSVAKSASSLFDPSKLRIHQSYYFGYYSGSAGNGSIGYYLNSIEYQVSSPLRIRVDLGFLHNPSAMLSGRASSRNSAVFLPGFSLDWRPSQYFTFRLDYRQVPAFNYGGYYHYYNPDLWEDYR
jgi:hypothetical protein